MNGYRKLLGRKAPLTLMALLIAGGTAMAADMASEDGSIRGRVLNAKSGQCQR